ncbi:MAG TPA: hypothetical protein VES20_08500 [Bryobacteraceae bacterium]|nr:hypothetical protein [Bryobacteraceae bacterium]
MMIGLTPVYRSSGMNASQDVEVVRNLLISSGLDAQLADDNQGLPDGTFEVRVPPDQAERAHQLLSSRPGRDETSTMDTSHDLDMVTLRRFDGTTGEIQALAIKGILDSLGINSVVVGTSSLPNLSFFLHVARTDFDRADEAIHEAEAAGPAAAIEAERQFDQP